MNRKELYDFAHTLDQKDAPVGALLQAIDEANQQLHLATWQLHVRAGSAMHFKQRHDFQHAGSFVKEANDYDIAAAKLNTLFLTLAVVLQQQGHQVDY